MIKNAKKSIHYFEKTWKRCFCNFNDCWHFFNTLNSFDGRNFGSIDCRCKITPRFCISEVSVGLSKERPFISYTYNGGWEVMPFWSFFDSCPQLEHFLPFFANPHWRTPHVPQSMFFLARQIVKICFYSNFATKRRTFLAYYILVFFGAKRRKFVNSLKTTGKFIKNTLFLAILFSNFRREAEIFFKAILF